MPQSLVPSWMLALLVGSGFVCQGTMQTGAAEPVAPVAKGAAAEIRTAEDLLAALEDADKGVHTLRAQIVYERYMYMQDESQIRYGSLYFRNERDAADAPPRRAFAITLEHMLVDDVMRLDQKHYIFDGEWLVEKILEEKLFRKMRIARPGERSDPFRVGEKDSMLVPLPVGQEKDAVLARYEAELLPAQSGLESEKDVEFRKFVADAWQLRLVPREEFAKEDRFTEIRLWYERDTLMPMMSRAVHREGDISTVQLVGVKKNDPQFPAAVIHIDPPQEEGWIIRIDEGRFAPRDEDASPAADAAGEKGNTQE